MRNESDGLIGVGSGVLFWIGSITVDNLNILFYRSIPTIAAKYTFV